jgi:hypothetical protein
VTDRFRQGVRWTKAQLPKAAPAPGPAALATVGAGTTAGGVPDAVEGETVAAGDDAIAPEAPTEEVRARAVVEGILAPRLPEPPRKARAAHWWRAAGLLVLGLYAVFSPGSLTSVIVVLLGVVALYLAITEAIAAWGSPREPKAPDGDVAPDGAVAANGAGAEEAAGTGDAPDA